MRPPLFVVASAALLLAAPALAEPPRASLHLEYARGPGGEACPAEGALHDEVARRMGYDPFDPAAAERLTIVVARQGRGFAAQLSRYAAGGAQTWAETFPVRGDDCGVLIAGLASEIRALLAPVQSQPAPTPAGGPLFGGEAIGVATPPASPPRDARPPAPTPTRALRFELAADAHLTFSGAPAVTGGATVRAAARWPWFGIGAEGRFDAAAVTSADGIKGAPGAQVSAQTFTAAVAPCAYYPNASVQPFGCGVVAAGVMSAAGTGVSMPGHDSGFVLLTGPRIGLEIPLHPRVSLRASFEALFFLSMPQVQLASLVVWRSPPVTGLGGLGLAVFL
jgi:hypothetical protein